MSDFKTTPPEDIAQTFSSLLVKVLFNSPILAIYRLTKNMKKMYLDF